MYNKLIFILLLMLSILIFYSCTFKINSRLILYGTDRFNNMELQAKLKKEDAWNIYIYHYQNYGLKKGSLVGIISNEYIFYNKQSASLGVTLSHTIRINMITGKVRFVKTSFIDGNVIQRGNIWNKGDEDSIKN